MLKENDSFPANIAPEETIRHSISFALSFATDQARFLILEKLILLPSAKALDPILITTLFILLINFFYP